MMTSYEVGAVFRIADQATPTLLKLSTELARIEKLALGVKSSFDRLGSMKTGNITGSLSKLSADLTKIADKAIITGDALQNGVGKASGVIAGAASKAELLRKELAASVTEASNLAKIKTPNFGRGGPNGGGGGGSGGGGGGGGRNNHPRPGSNRGHNGGHRAGEVGLQLGIFGSIGTHEVGHFLKDALKEASELEHIRQQMYTGGLDRDIHTGKTGNVNHATKEAWKMANKYGLNVSGVLGDIKELALPFGSIDHAIEFVEPLEKMKIVLEAMSEGKGKEARDAVYKMARAGELKGLVDGKDYLKYFDSMTKAITASGGKITPNSFAQVTQYGKLSSFGWSEEFYTKYLPTLMQTMGPTTAGQSLMSLFSTLGGTVKGDAAIAMNELGLIDDPSKLKFNKQGKITGFTRGAVEKTDLFNSNPLEWARQVLLPKLEAKFGDLNDAKNKEAAIGYMGSIFGNRNSAAAAAELALRMKTFDRDHAMIGQAKGLDAANALMKEDPVTAMNRLKGAWDNFMTMLGGPGVQAAIAAMNALSTGLTALTKWGNEHPDAMKNILAAATGLAAALAVLTVAGVIAAATLLGPAGVIASAAVVLAGVITGLAAANWEAVKTGFKAAMDYIKEGLEWWANFGAKIREKIGLGAAPPSGGNGPGEGVVPSRIPMGYDGPTFGSGAGIIKAAFETGGAVENGSADERFAKCVYVGVLAALRDYGGTGGGGGGGGGFGGGSGFHRASFGGGGLGGGLGGAGAPGALGNAPAGSLTELINREARAAGIDPRIMQGIRAGESLKSDRYDVKDDAIESSWGPFQLNRRKGLGVQFEKETGLDVRDPRTIPAQVRWVAQFLRKGGSLRNWAGYRGPRDAQPGWGNAGLVTGDFGGLGGVVNGDLRIKGGINGQATGGGGHASGLTALAEQLQRAGGFDRVTAFNDRYHAGTGSMHARGLAMDLTGDPKKLIANAQAMMEAAGLKEGSDYRIINEYAHRSRRWTGGHVHFEFRSREAAEAYAAQQRGRAVPTAGAPPKPTAPEKLQPIHVNLGGQRVATAIHRVLAQNATHPTSAGGMDAHGTFRSPGTPQIDAA